MCDFICFENIKSLIDYIVTAHLNRKNPGTPVDVNYPSLEDIANPYVDTFKQLRKMYNENNKPEQPEGRLSLLGSDLNINGNHDGLQLNGGEKVMLNEKALEDQVSARNVSLCA